MEDELKNKKIEDDLKKIKKIKTTPKKNGKRPLKKINQNQPNWL
jgi:hypothetical protein